jgi:CRISPR-associated protein Cas1
MTQDREEKNRLLIKVTRETLPQVKDKYPFLYLERGRLEIDDSSVKWIDSEANVIRLPIATVNCLLLGPGTSVTHEAVKVLGSANCSVCWVGEDSFHFYAAGLSPTANTRNLLHQAHLAAHPEKTLEVVKRMLAKRFPGADLQNKKLAELRGMEGLRVRRLYEEKAVQYSVGWKGRQYIPGNFEMSDMTNKILTATNTALYAIVNSCILAMGYSPHIGFLHSGSPLPFTYDIADLYKANLCIDLAFSLTFDMAGVYNRHKLASAFRTRLQDIGLLTKVGNDIKHVLGEE